MTAPKDSSYLFANMTNLTKVNNLKNLNTVEVENAEGMFKNDSSLKKLNLYTWSFKKADTGNSALGQGMFDGTNLETIVLNGSLKFSEGTALTSKNGIKWVSDKDDKGNHSFYGVPSIDNKGNARGGIGGLYNGINNVVGTNDKGDKTDKLTYNATGKAEVDKQINNLITIPTDHGDITVNVAGNYGKPDNEVKIPDTWSFDGHDYERESSSPSSVNVEFGLTEGQANLGREIVFVEKKAEPDNPTATPAPTEPMKPTEKPQVGHKAEPAKPETPVTPDLSNPNGQNNNKRPQSLNTSNNHSVQHHHSNFQSSQYIAAYKKKSGVEVYTLNQMNNLEKVSNTELDPVMNEKGVSIIDIQGTKYYRLSNNRLIRIADAYIYTPVNLSAKAHPDKYINIFTAEGYLIRSEKLANIILNIDAFTYINGEKYYRISNNEFVRSIDVTLY